MCPYQFPSGHTARMLQHVTQYKSCLANESTNHNAGAAALTQLPRRNEPGAWEGVQGALVQDIEDDVECIPAGSITQQYSSTAWLSDAVGGCTHVQPSALWFLAQRQQDRNAAGTCQLRSCKHDIRQRSTCRTHQSNMYVGTFQLAVGCGASAAAPAPAAAAQHTACRCCCGCCCRLHS